MGGAGSGRRKSVASLSGRQRNAERRQAPRKFMRPIGAPPLPTVPLHTVIKNACVFCGSSDLTTLWENANYKARVGCLACNRWLTEEESKR